MDLLPEMSKSINYELPLTCRIQRMSIKRKPVILHIIDHWGLGGAQRSLATLVRHESTCEHKIAVLFANRIHKWVSPVQPFFLGHRYANLPSILSRLRHLMKSQKLDIIQVHLNGSRFVFWLATLGFKKLPPVIWHEHSGEEIFDRFGENPGKILIFLQRLMLKKISAVIADSPYIKEFCSRHFNVRAPKLKLIYYPIDVDNILSQADRSPDGGFPDIRKGDEFVGFVGRLSSQKGLEDLFEIAGRLVADRPRCRIWIVGDGPLKDFYFNKTAISKYADRFFFWGARHDVYAIMKHMDLLLMPSRYEPFGLVAMEAFLLGKPVVGYKVGGLAKLLEDFPLGFGIPYGNREAMYQQAFRLLEGPNKIEQKLDNPFEASRVAREWGQYYQELLNSRE